MLFLVLSLLVGLLDSPAVLPAQPAPIGVTVTATYSGPGPVDDSHPIWVFMLDTDSIAPDVRPIAFQPIFKNGGSVTFEASGAVFIRTAYAEQPGYDPNVSGRPAGLPIGMFTTDGKTAAPITIGSGAKVTVTFDDRVRLP